MEPTDKQLVKFYKHHVAVHPFIGQKNGGIGCWNHFFDLTLNQLSPNGHFYLLQYALLYCFLEGVSNY